MILENMLKVIGNIYTLNISYTKNKINKLISLSKLFRRVPFSLFSYQKFNNLKRVWEGFTKVGKVLQQNIIIVNSWWRVEISALKLLMLKSEVIVSIEFK